MVGMVAARQDEETLPHGLRKGGGNTPALFPAVAEKNHFIKRFGMYVARGGKAISRTRETIMAAMKK